MELALYHIDAFANEPFEGNPAAICPLNAWLPDELMQAIAAENNLSETAFFVPTDQGYHIRWFTPLHEVKLCGHATLASAYVIFNILGYEEQQIAFESRSGILTVTKIDDWLELDFPTKVPTVCSTPEQILNAFSATPTECLKADDYIVVFDNEADVAEAIPDIALLAQLDLRGVAITAKSLHYDFVTRFFAPKHGLAEDPVTGSIFTELIPYWSEKLNKTELTAKQISARGGEVGCVYAGDRVKISGRAVQYLVGTIYIHNSR
jgi:PhzF family phenazine biosynthesis protein